MTYRFDTSRPKPCPYMKADQTCDACKGSRSCISPFDYEMVQIIEQPKDPVRVVVCAANKYGDKVFLGARHFDERMRESMEFFDIPKLRKAVGEVQGFIDQWGVFMDRKEAYQVALEAGQINVRRPKSIPAEKLFSEDIY
jgi:hypothetical protein